MRTARMIGITDKGEEEILHPKSTPIQKQIGDFQEMSRKGIAKKFAAVEFQTSDGRTRTLRNGITAGLKDAEARAQDKKDNADKWLKDQAEKRSSAQKKEAEEQQARINAANAEKEKAKKALFQVSGK